MTGEMRVSITHCELKWEIPNLIGYIIAKYLSKDEKPY
jgi:hypothetical protein